MMMNDDDDDDDDEASYIFLSLLNQKSIKSFSSIRRDSERWCVV